MNKFITIKIVLLLLFIITIPVSAEAETSGKQYALGWQFSRPANGFCLKIPFQEKYYLQPIFSISRNENDKSTTGHYALGIRGIYNLPKHQDVLPYAGAALGYSESFRKTDDTLERNSNLAYEVFFGIEYQKYLLRPALEIGIGGLNKYDHTLHAGVILNLSVLYYF